MRAGSVSPPPNAYATSSTSNVGRNGGRAADLNVRPGPSRSLWAFLCQCGSDSAVIEAPLGSRPLPGHGAFPLNGAGAAVERVGSSQEEHKVRESAASSCAGVAVADVAQPSPANEPEKAAEPALQSFTDADLIEGEKPVLLDTGHPDTKVYTVPLWRKGERFDAIFKPLYPLDKHAPPTQPVEGMLAERPDHGFLNEYAKAADADKERYTALADAERNLASRRVDEALFNVMAKTYLGLLTLPETGKPAYGLVMERAEGVQVSQASVKALEDAGVKRASRACGSTTPTQLARPNLRSSVLGEQRASFQHPVEAQRAEKEADPQMDGHVVVRDGMPSEARGLAPHEETAPHQAECAPYLVEEDGLSERFSPELLPFTNWHASDIRQPNGFVFVRQSYGRVSRDLPIIVVGVTTCSVVIVARVQDEPQKTEYLGIHHDSGFLGNRFARSSDPVPPPCIPDTGFIEDERSGFPAFAAGKGPMLGLLIQTKDALDRWEEVKRMEDAGVVMLRPLIIETPCLDVALRPTSGEFFVRAREAKGGRVLHYRDVFTREAYETARRLPSSLEPRTDIVGRLVEYQSRIKQAEGLAPATTQALQSCLDIVRFRNCDRSKAKRFLMSLVHMPGLPEHLWQAVCNLGIGSREGMVALTTLVEHLLAGGADAAGATLSV